LLGQAWVYDGEWYLLNASSGAPSAKATVNGGVPGLGLSAQLRRGLLAASAGLDARYGVGDWQHLPVGTGSWRTELYPHLGVGLPWLQVTAGAWFPWRLGLGARAQVPLVGPLELVAGGLGGIGLPITRDGGQPSFQASPSFAAWAGVGVRLQP